MERLLRTNDLALRTRFLDDFPITETAKLDAFELDPDLIVEWDLMSRVGRRDLKTDVDALKALKKPEVSSKNGIV